MIEFDYDRESERYRDIVEKELRRIASGENGNVYPKLLDAMFYSLEVGGKRIRPCLVLAVCEMLGGNVENALPFACGLEMIHTYSLIHDDLPCVDNDDMRRGRPSNHKLFGEGMAVFAGCGLLSLALEVMLKAVLKSNDRGGLLAMNEIAYRSGAHGMLSGQAADIENEGSTSQDEEVLAYIHEHKTADMLTAAVLAGAYTAGADEKTVDALRAYALNMGLLFQITDDILDVKGDSAMMGKTLGKDAANGKMTYVGLYELDGARMAAEKAAKLALDALKGIESPNYLEETIRRMLVRSR